MIQAQSLSHGHGPRRLSAVVTSSLKTMFGNSIPGHTRRPQRRRANPTVGQEGFELATDGIQFYVFLPNG